MKAYKAVAPSQRVDAVADPFAEYVVVDARTLWAVQNQSTAKLGRTFVSAVDESRANPMPDAKIVENRDAIHVCKEIAESSGKLT